MNIKNLLTLAWELINVPYMPGDTVPDDGNMPGIDNDYYRYVPDDSPSGPCVPGAQPAGISTWAAQLAGVDIENASHEYIDLRAADWLGLRITSPLFRPFEFAVDGRQVAQMIFRALNHPKRGLDVVDLAIPEPFKDADPVEIDQLVCSQGGMAENGQPHYRGLWLVRHIADFMEPLGTVSATCYYPPSHRPATLFSPDYPVLIDDSDRPAFSLIDVDMQVTFPAWECKPSHPLGWLAECLGVPVNQSEEGMYRQCAHFLGITYPDLQSLLPLRTGKFHGMDGAEKMAEFIRCRADELSLEYRPDRPIR